MTIKTREHKMFASFFVSCFSVEAIGALSCIGLYTQSGELTSENDLNLSRKEFYAYWSWVNNLPYVLRLILRLFSIRYTHDMGRYKIEALFGSISCCNWLIGNQKASNTLSADSLRYILAKSCRSRQSFYSSPKSKKSIGVLSDFVGFFRSLSKSKMQL